MVGGYVYILINPCMPGLLKIGHSTRSPEERARELSQVTGVPVSFTVAYQEEFELHFREAEQEVHRQLEHFRFNQNREFFSIPLRDAIRVMACVAHQFREREEIELREAAAAAAKVAGSPVQPPQVTETPRIAQRIDFPFQLVARLTVKCTFCSEVYTVTFRRHEDRSCCPHCNRMHPVDIKW